MQALYTFISTIPWWGYLLLLLLLIAIRDILVQRAHTISHNFPIIGHIRYMLESIGPELRQYLVANNREEHRFKRIE